MLGALRLFGAICLIVGLWLTPASAERRIALVVGNSDYQHVGKLANPRNDAEDLSRHLELLGFEVMGEPISTGALSWNS